MEDGIMKRRNIIKKLPIKRIIITNWETAIYKLGIIKKENTTGCSPMKQYGRRID